MAEFKKGDLVRITWKGWLGDCVHPLYNKEGIVVDVEGEDAYPIYSIRIDGETTRWSSSALELAQEVIDG